MFNRFLGDLEVSKIQRTNIYSSPRVYEKKFESFLKISVIMEPSNFEALFETDGYLRPHEHEIRRR